MRIVRNGRSTSWSDGNGIEAAAQGITYLVSSGDSGAEGCDDPSIAPATHPISVNYLALTAFNTAVGGNIVQRHEQYWSVLGVGVESSKLCRHRSFLHPRRCVERKQRNEGSVVQQRWSERGNVVSGVGTTPGVPKPNWQYGVTGIPNDGVRDLPDVSLTAAQHDPYLLCLEGSCEPNSQGEIGLYFVGGTSAATPAFAGIMGLVDQKAGSLGGQSGRQGMANYILYRLAATQNNYPSQCNGSNTSTFPASDCIFNDVTTGNNVVPGETGTEYQAGPGYDLTTGLGSVNVANLVNQWSTVTFNPTSTAVSTSTTNITHGSPVPFTATPPNSGTGSPTGKALYSEPHNPQTQVGPVWECGTCPGDQILLQRTLSQAGPTS